MKDYKCYIRCLRCGKRFGTNLSITKLCPTCYFKSIKRPHDKFKWIKEYTNNDKINDSEGSQNKLEV